MTTSLVPGGAGFQSTGPTAQQAAAFTATEAAHVQQPLQRPTRGGFVTAAGGVVSDPGNFPVQMYPTDVAMDTDAVIRQAVVTQGQNVFYNAAGQAVQPNITYAIGEKDFKFYQAKMEAEELAAYERWINLQFDFTKPAEVERFARMYPDYFERRLANLRNISNANLRYAEILCTGCQSPDDYLYLYMVQTGRIPLIQGPIWNPSSWFAPQSAAQLKMAMFNPFKIYASRQTGPFAAAPLDGNFQYPGLPSAQYTAAARLAQRGNWGNNQQQLAASRALTGIPAPTNSIATIMAP